MRSSLLLLAPSATKFGFKRASDLVDERYARVHPRVVLHLRARVEDVECGVEEVNALLITSGSHTT
jgi:hypothetical protein